MKNRKRLWIVVGVAAVLIGAAVAKSKFSKKGTEVELAKAELGSITEIVSANGKVQPEIEVVISPEVPGEIIEIPVKEGDLVKKGDLLVRINPDILISTRNRMVANLNSSKANLANAKARLAQTEAQFINAELSFNRSKKLKADGAISESQFDGDKANYEVSKAEVEAAKESVEAARYNVKNAEAALDEADRNLERTTIYAPMNGTVSSLSVEVGERVVGTSQMSGTEIMRIANLEQMEVLVDVNESDIVRVRQGDIASIEVDAYLGRKFKGEVTEIANSAKNQSLTGDQVTNFEVKIRILKSSYKDLIDSRNPHLSPFRPGMSATVDVETEEVKNVVKVPVQAVCLRKDTTATADEDEEELRECVFGFSDGKAIMFYVKTGIQDSRFIEIKSGITAEQEIIIGPYDVVSKKLEHQDLVQEKEEEEKDKKRA